MKDKPAPYHNLNIYYGDLHSHCAVGYGHGTLLIPHHIGYKQGYRGINWDAFDPEFSPVVEIMSMHGASESPEAPYPYLHAMGPRDWRGMYQYGLAQGHLAGAIGSTDHHSAHPGSYGHGRLGVWAENLDRRAIWRAIKARRTYALTGDRIALAFSLNDEPQGSILPRAGTQGICLTISGDASSLIRGEINGQLVEVKLNELVQGPLAGYLGGLKTPAYYFHKAVPEALFTCQVDFTHHGQNKIREWYTVRVRQVNGQWAWSSPIWINS